MKQMKKWLLILLAMWQNQGNQTAAMGMLAASLLLIGGVLIWRKITAPKDGIQNA